MKLFVLAGIKSISNLFDGSFFVPYFTSIICSKKQTTLYCLSVWNVVKDHLALSRRNRVASRKRVQRYSFFLNYQTNRKNFLKKVEKKLITQPKSAQLSQLSIKFLKKAWLKHQKSLLSKKHHNMHFQRKRHWFALPLRG